MHIPLIRIRIEMSAHSTVACSLAQDAACLAGDDIPADVHRLARQSLLDWVGCAVAGIDDPVAGSVLRIALSQGGFGPATLLASDARTTARAAALVNGVAGHALDFDDVNLVMMGHPTAAAAPALLAVADQRQSTGEELLVAFAVACRTMYRLSRYLGPGHYAQGWHATATIGAIGAAAGCARLCRLDAEGIVAAIAIAASHAGGMKASFGSDVKPVQVGLAAASAVDAAFLAAEGIRSHEDIIEHVQGFAATHGGSTCVLPPAAEDHRGILFKYHASCYGTQAAIDAARLLRTQLRGAVDGIRSIRLSVKPKWLRVCNLTEPRSANEVKFSLATTAALGLLGRETSRIETFEEAVSDETVRRLASLVDVVGAAELDDAEVCLSATLHGGDRLDASHNAGIPDPDLERQERRLEAKFMALASPRLGELRARAAIESIRNLANAPRAAALMEMLAA